MDLYSRLQCSTIPDLDLQTYLGPHKRPELTLLYILTVDLKF